MRMSQLVARNFPAPDTKHNTCSVQNHTYHYVDTFLRWTLDSWLIGPEFQILKLASIYKRSAFHMHSLLTLRVMNRTHLPSPGIKNM